MVIHLSERGQRLIDSLVQGGRYDSGDQVVDEALRLLEERDRQVARARQRVEALLIEGLESGPATPMTPEDWDEIEREGRRLIAARKGRDAQ